MVSGEDFEIYRFPTPVTNVLIRVRSVRVPYAVMAKAMVATAAVGLFTVVGPIGRTERQIVQIRNGEDQIMEQ